ncbi:MAG: hypothetical protein NC343_05520 [Muribaculum sp.]|nr:hypothetical protein [Muribaculaceae bacterium]MCM1081190.1 hypothetical protein [Muribaculum sp.]
MKKITALKLMFVALVALITMPEPVKAENEYAKPDFAFPVKVADNSLAQMRQAEKTGDGKLLVRSIINYAYARQSVDADSVGEVLKMAENYADKSDDPIVASLLRLWLAQTYGQLYNSNKWKYDNRQLPSEPLAADYRQWSGEQFRDVIADFCNKAVEPAVELRAAKLKSYDGVVTLPEGSADLYPTVYDFVMLRTVMLLEQISVERPQFPADYMDGVNEFCALTYAYQPQLTRRILETLRAWLQAQTPGTPPMVATDLVRLDFTGRYLANDVADSLRFAAYKNVYERNARLAESGNALMKAADCVDYDNVDQNAKLLQLADVYVKQHPRTRQAECLRGVMKRIEQKRINVEYAQTVVPGGVLKVKVTGFNADEYQLRLYRVNADWNNYGYYNWSEGEALPSFVKAITKASKGRSVPFTVDDTVSIAMPGPGRYIVVPTVGAFSNAELKKNSYPVVYCSNYLIATMAYAPNVWAVTVNPLTGRPEAGVTLEQLTNKGVLLKRYVTDSVATAVIDAAGSGSLRARSGGDHYAAPVYVSQPYSPQKGNKFAVHVFTDLALYHLGDTVRWCTVAQSYGPAGESVVANCRLKAILRDANYQLIDTMEVTTDGFGRAQGRFKLPSSGLTGNFAIQLAGMPGEKNIRGGVNFKVSDYKLPTFRIDSLTAQVNVPQIGAVTVKGEAITYSGFPLEGCEATIELSVSDMTYRWWWHGGMPTSFYTAKGLTGADGQFFFELPKELLAQSPIRNGVFTAEVTVTSATGETHQSATRFVLGKQCFISADVDENIDVSSGYMLLHGDLIDCNGNNMTGRLVLTLTNSNGEVALQSPLQAGKTERIATVGVPSGEYTVVIAPADTAMAQPLNIGKRVIYRDSDRYCPAKDTPLWTPHKTVRLTAGEREAQIVIGSSSDTIFVHYAIYGSNSLLEQGWTTTGRELKHLPVTLPDNIDKVTAKLWTVSGYNATEATVEVLATPQPGIVMEIESFRDRIIPGQQEKWRFRIKDTSGRGVRSALMLDMYNQALDQLIRHSFRLSPYRVGSVGFNINYTLNRGFSSASSRIGLQDCKATQLPELQTWGRSMASTRLYGQIKMARSYANAKVEATAVADMGSETMMATDLMLASGADSAESIDEEVAMAEVDKNEDTGVYRQSEMTVALFEPMLTTDDEGGLEFNFTAPNANTTWQLYAQAFTNKMLCASNSYDIVSAKPIMVQPNLPRFMRAGDEAVVKALVMNNTDTTIVASTTIELFNPLNDKAITTITRLDTIAPMQAATVTVTAEANAGLTAIGYRIRSTQGVYADGEQALIPVLEASQPVVETLPFYISPGQQTFSLQLPELDADARVTLQFTQNPTWYVATALPGLRKNEAGDALGAGAALFSAATAKGILRDNPEIADALRQWTEKGDTMLISMLEKNVDLKTVLLNSTPWVMDAQSDTERMARLAMLMDSATVADEIALNIEKLKKLSCAGGGWKWIEQSAAASTWATENLLFIFGRLDKMGYLPDEATLGQMIKNAVAYVDAETAKQLKKTPEMTDVAYSYLRTIYYADYPVGEQLKKLIDRTAKRLSEQWKTASAPAKAMAAILLEHTGYKQQVAQIMLSLSEYAVSSESKGMWWPTVEDSEQIWWTPSAVARTCIILDAYSLLMPDTDAVDKIRQWIILQKEAQNWGTGVATTEVVATLLSTGSNWTRPQRQATIRIGGKKLAQTATDARLGCVRADITDLSPSGKMLTFDNVGQTPSWGAVYCQNTAPMKDIRAQSCTDLSIEKRIYKRVDTPAGAQWVEADTLHVGDIVQVNLTVRAGRSMDYVAIIDERAACLEPTDQLPGPIWSEGLCFYRENREATTNIFVDRMPKGVYSLSYTLTVNNSGQFASGVASVQSQYAPQLSAHSSGTQLTIE